MAGPAGRPDNEALLARGVTMRTVYLDSVRKDRATVQHAEWLTGLGCEVRTAPALPLRMLALRRPPTGAIGGKSGAGWVI
ncbi:hypothetical protein [Kitasatospora sp. NPDC094011]|uniref:hypothetical protein n=1 Tax=Kitasatospora sp. NPDC094011 TaxID=3364090 RepID=UPI003818483F